MTKNYLKLSATFMATVAIAVAAGQYHPALAALACLGGTCAIAIFAGGCNHG